MIKLDFALFRERPSILHDNANALRYSDAHVDNHERKTMSIEEDIKNLKKYVRYPDIVKHLENMSQVDRDAVISAIENSSISAVQLAKILTTNGYPTSADALKALRRGDLKSITIQDLKEKFS